MEPPKVVSAEEWGAANERIIAKEKEARASLLDLFEGRRQQFVYNFSRLAIVADPSGAVFAAWEQAEHKGAQVVNEPGACRPTTYPALG